MNKHGEFKQAVLLMLEAVKLQYVIDNSKEDIKEYSRNLIKKEIEISVSKGKLSKFEMPTLLAEVDKVLEEHFKTPPKKTIVFH